MKLELKTPLLSTGPAVYIFQQKSFIFSQLCGIGKYASGLTFPVKYLAALFESEISSVEIVL